MRAATSRAFVAVLVLAISACGAAPAAKPAAASAATATAAPSPDLTSFYSQSLDWSACGKNQCANLTVPLDYTKPAGETIKIAVLRLAATDQQNKMGALVINPGGPGGSGVDFAAQGASYYSAKLRRSFDIVGFDPRGVGKSTALKCGDTALTDRLVGMNPEPSTAAQRDEDAAVTREFGQACLTNSGELARHLSTVEAARDMDVLRAALGEESLYFMGSSYGTYLGATYADLFPTKVGRMVLDGALDPTLSTVDLTLAQAGGFETALRAYVADCVKQSDCPLSGSVDQAVGQIRKFLDSVKATPLPTSSDRQLNEALALYGIWMPLYRKDWWSALTAALGQAMTTHSGTKLLELADAYASRGAASYEDNSIAILADVDCLDHDDAVPDSQVAQYLPRFLAASPTFGRAFASTLSSCGDWPIQSGLGPKALHAKGAPPIVVVGSTRDPATPLAWARALASQLSSGVLVTRDGDGHTGYHQGSTCVDSAVDSYFVDGKVPQNGLSC